MEKTLMEDNTAIKSRLFILVCIVACIFATGCTGKRSEKELKAIAITEGALDSNLSIIQTIKPHLAELDVEFDNLPHPSDMGRDYFNLS